MGAQPVMPSRNSNKGNLDSWESENLIGRVKTIEQYKAKVNNLDTRR